MRHNNIEIYDPRANQNYDFINFQTKSKVSSIDHRLLVIECYASIDWRIYRDVINRSFGYPSERHFAALVPWPGAEFLAENIIQSSTETLNSDGAIFSYLPCATSICNILEQAYTKDPHSWGELSLGGCRAGFAPPKKRTAFQNVSWDLAQLLDQVENINWVLTLSEMEHSLFIAKLIDSEVENNCDELATDLHQKLNI